MHHLREISTTKVHNVKNLDVAIPISNSREYSGNYSKTSISLVKYFRDEPGQLFKS